MENIKYNKKSRTDISRSVPWPRAKTMPLDEPAKMIMNRFSIIENYLICNDKQWTNFSIGFLRLKRRFPWFNAVPDRSGCIDACRESWTKSAEIFVKFQIGCDNLKTESEIFFVPLRHVIFQKEALLIQRQLPQKSKRVILCQIVCRHFLSNLRTTAGGLTLSPDPSNF